MVGQAPTRFPEAEILDALDIAHEEIKKLARCSASWPSGSAGEESLRGDPGR